MTRGWITPKGEFVEVGQGTREHMGIDTLKALKAKDEKLNITRFWDAKAIANPERTKSWEGFSGAKFESFQQGYGWLYEKGYIRVIRFDSTELGIEGRPEDIEALKFEIAQIFPRVRIWVYEPEIGSPVVRSATIDEFLETDIDEAFKRSKRSIGPTVFGRGVKYRGKGWWGESWRHKLARRKD